MSDNYGINFSNADLVLPSSECISKFLRRAKNSAPGPDGLPYAAWLACGNLGASTLHGILIELATDESLQQPLTTRASFLPKTDVCCPGGIIAAPGAMRPLGLNKY